MILATADFEQPTPIFGQAGYRMNQAKTRYTVSIHDSSGTTYRARVMGCDDWLPGTFYSLKNAKIAVEAMIGRRVSKWSDECP